MSELHGRVVVLTGVTSGIGRATARRLLDRGAVVVGCARDADRLGQVADALPGLVPQVCDVRDPAERVRLVDGVLARHGCIHGLVNNAGVGWQGFVAGMSYADVERIYATNLIAAVDLTRLVLPSMIERRAGVIVVVASVAAYLSVPPLTVYCSSKAGLDSFAEGLRREVWRDGVIVSEVCPGPVATEFLARTLGHSPAEREPGLRAAPGVSADRVAAAVVRCLGSRRPRRVCVPRGLGLAQLLRVQPFRPLTDVATTRLAPALVRFGRGLAERRTPGFP